MMTRERKYNKRKYNDKREKIRQQERGKTMMRERKDNNEREEIK